MNNRVITTTNVEKIGYEDRLKANLIYWPLKQGGGYIFKNRWGKRGFISNEDLTALLDLANEWSKEFDLSNKEA